MPAHGIMFHHFHGGPHAPSQGSIDADALRGMLQAPAIGRILPASDWLAGALGGRLRDEDVCLTFDDTLQCQFDIARPVLNELGLTGFWFVSTATLEGRGPHLDVHRAFRERHFPGTDDFHVAFFEAVRRSAFGDEAERRLRDFDPGTFLSEFPFYSDDDRRYRYLRDEVLGPVRFGEVMAALMARVGADEATLSRGLWMDAAAVRTLAAEGHLIGLHSHTHPTRMAYLSAADQHREYRDNYMGLMELLGEAPVAVSHPCNSYNETTLAILRKLGIGLGFRADLSPAPRGPLEMPREDHTLALRRVGPCKSPYSPAISRAMSH